MPDVIVPEPGIHEIAKSFADLLGISYAPVLDRWNGQWECDTDLLDEDQILLLLGGEGSAETWRGAIEALGSAFPKRMYVLSLSQLQNYPPL